MIQQFKNCWLCRRGRCIGGGPLGLHWRSWHLHWRVAGWRGGLLHWRRVWAYCIGGGPRVLVLHWRCLHGCIGGLSESGTQ